MYGILRLLVIILAVIGLGGLVAAAYWLEPFGFGDAKGPTEEASITFVRLTDREVRQNVLFSTPCDPGGPHLYVGDGKDIRLALRTRWPDDLPAVEDSDFAAPGNRFLLEGYPVVRTTGKAITPALYFDVIAWSPIAPYRLWRGDGDEVTEENDVSEPVTFHSTIADPTFKTPPHTNDGGC